MESTESKPTRRWQNLLYKKCPNCNERLEDARLFWKCPNTKEDGKSCFFIKQLQALEYLMNPEHPANRCLSLSEREHLKELLGKTGIIL